MNSRNISTSSDNTEKLPSQILTPEELKSLSNFLLSLDPRLGYSDKRRNKVVSQLNGGITAEGTGMFGQLSIDEYKPDYKKAKGIIQSLTGVAISNVIHLSFGTKRTIKPRDPYSGEKMPYYVDEWEFSTDSNVYLLDDGKHIMKLYVSFGKDEIMAYHVFQNKLAEKEYDVNHSGEIKGQSFHSVHVNILKLPEDGVMGSSYTSIALIPFVQGNTLAVGADDITNVEKLDASIMAKIWEENNLKSHVPENHRMNFKFNEIKDGVLYVTVTDIGNSIGDILKQEGLYDYSIQKFPRLKEIIHARYQQIMNGFRIKL